VTAYLTQPTQDEFTSARAHLETLIAQLGSDEATTMTHAALEELVTREGRELQRRLAQGHFDLRAAREAARSSLLGADNVERTHRRQRSRPLVTVFGKVTALRWTYGARGHSGLSPLDAALNLPEELYSHGLRHLAAVEAARGSFDQAVLAIARATGVCLPKRQLEQLAARAAVDFDAFYDGAVAEPAQPGDLLVLTLDNKGIVMRHEHLRPATQQKADASQHKLPRRLSKGEKRNRKRMATVAAVYDQLPYVRVPADIFAELRPVRDAATPRPRAKNKRVWARVDKSAEEVTAEVFAEAQRRDPQHQRRWVALVDGDRHQIARVRAAARRQGVEVTLVVDFIHVLEYLWKAAWCFFDEGDRAADAWVAERARWILEGRSGAVAGGIRRGATRRGLAASARTGVDECASYLISKRRMLRYDDYLRAGLPIATGVIEGACRHLVNDRMDITGARWSVGGAEAVLRLRSLRSSGDFDAYWNFHLEAEHRRHHVSRYADQASPTAPMMLRLIRGGASS